MFYCQITGELSDEGESPVIVVVQKRRKEYYGIKVRKRRGKPSSSSRPGKTPYQRPGTVEKIGDGWEVVKAINVRRSTLERLEKEDKKIECRWV